MTTRKVITHITVNGEEGQVSVSFELDPPMPPTPEEFAELSDDERKVIEMAQMITDNTVEFINGRTQPKRSIII